jgi:hypothetical protein
VKPDAGSLELPESEKARVRSRYWSYHCGSIIPSWLDAIVSEDALWIYHDRIFYRREHFAWTEGWFYLGCAIELEHRAAPAQTLRQLRRLAAKVRRPGYDFTEAKLLEEEVRKLDSLHWAEIHRGTERWLAEIDQRMLDAHPMNKDLLLKIETMKLPHGAGPNLTLMRTIVGAEKKVKNE